MIPKILHYIWFGKGPKPQQVLDCIDSWKKHLSHYELMEWNETNAPVEHPFVKYCLEQKQWAYASDYVRLWALYNYGGVYLDTDMEVVKDFSRLFENREFAIAYENEKLINAAIMGCVAYHPMSKKMLSVYDSLILVEPIPNLLTKVFAQQRDCMRNKKVFIGSPEQFYPLAYHSKEFISNEFYTIHHWQASWKSTFQQFQFT